MATKAKAKNQPSVPPRADLERLRAALGKGATTPVSQSDTSEDKGEYTVVGRWKSTDEVRAILSGSLYEVTATDIPSLAGTGFRVYTEDDDAPEAVAASLRMSVFANPGFGVDGDADPRLVWQTPRRSDEVGHWGCPFTVEDDGRVYGHLATVARCHGAYGVCKTIEDIDPTYDFSAYTTGEAERGVSTGPIVIGTTHSVGPDGTIKGYDWLAHTGMAVADVAIGKDQHGIWVAGKVRPGITPAQLAALKGSALSGEWLPYGPKLRLAGILAVNGPGFLIERNKKPVTAAVYTNSPIVACGGDSQEDDCGCGCPGDVPATTEVTPQDRIAFLEDALAKSLRNGIVDND